MNKYLICFYGDYIEGNELVSFSFDYDSYSLIELNEIKFDDDYHRRVIHADSITQAMTFAFELYAIQESDISQITLLKNNFIKLINKKQLWKQGNKYCAALSAMDCKADR